MTFPTFEPSSRTYTHGEWPVSRHKFMTGRSQQLLHANKKSNQRLRLTYDNRPLKDFDYFLEHFNAQRGTHGSFPLTPNVLFAGWNNKQGDAARMGYDQRWRYVKEPRIRSRRGMYGSMEIELQTTENVLSYPTHDSDGNPLGCDPCASPIPSTSSAITPRTPNVIEGVNRVVNDSCTGLTGLYRLYGRQDCYNCVFDEDSFGLFADQDGARGGSIINVEWHYFVWYQEFSEHPASCGAYPCPCIQYYPGVMASYYHQGQRKRVTGLVRIVTDYSKGQTIRLTATPETEGEVCPEPDIWEGPVDTPPPTFGSDGPEGGWTSGPNAPPGGGGDNGGECPPLPPVIYPPAPPVNPPGPGGTGGGGGGPDGGGPSGPTPSPSPGPARETQSSTANNYFPTHNPSRRRITYGDYEVDRFGQAQEVTMPLPSTAQKTDLVMQLVYANQPDSVARSFMDHYDEAYGNFAEFSIPAGTAENGTFAGWTSNRSVSKGKWLYARPPQIVTTHPGYSSTTIQLINIEPAPADKDNLLPIGLCPTGPGDPVAPPIICPFGSELVNGVCVPLPLDRIPRIAPLRNRTQFLNNIYTKGASCVADNTCEYKESSNYYWSDQELQLSEGVPPFRWEKRGEWNGILYSEPAYAGGRCLQWRPTNEEVIYPLWVLLDRFDKIMGSYGPTSSGCENCCVLPEGGQQSLYMSPSWTIVGYRKFFDDEFGPKGNYYEPLLEHPPLGPNLYLS